MCVLFVLMIAAPIYELGWRGYFEVVLGDGWYALLPLLGIIAIWGLFRWKRTFSIDDSGISYRQRREVFRLEFENVRTYYFKGGEWWDPADLVVEEWDRSFADAHKLPVGLMKRKDAGLLIDIMRSACTRAVKHPKNVFKGDREGGKGVAEPGL